MKLIYLASILPFVLLSFKNPRTAGSESIDKIKYTSYSGDKGGNFFDLQITKGLTVLIKGNRSLSETFQKPTDATLWKQLVRINLERFDEIQGSPRAAPHDGTDVELAVITGTHTHSVLNGAFGDSKKIRSVVRALDQEMRNTAIEKNKIQR